MTTRWNCRRPTTNDKSQVGRALQLRQVSLSPSHSIPRTKPFLPNKATSSNPSRHCPALQKSTQLSKTNTNNLIQRDRSFFVGTFQGVALGTETCLINNEELAPSDRVLGTRTSRTQTPSRGSKRSGRAAARDAARRPCSRVGSLVPQTSEAEPTPARAATSDSKPKTQNPAPSNTDRFSWTVVATPHHLSATAAVQLISHVCRCPFLLGRYCDCKNNNNKINNNNNTTRHQVGATS